MIRISNIKMAVQSSENDLKNKVLSMLDNNEPRLFKISKKSIDARKKNDIHYVYSVDVEIENEEIYVKKYKNMQFVKKYEYNFPKGQITKNPIVIVGTGPAGLMCGLLLAQNNYKVILIERGKNVDDRIKDVEYFWENGKLDTESNVQFGEGGAGTFSDGKLTTGIKDFRIQKVLEEFHKHGAPEEILYYSKPHVGTDNLAKMVKSIRNEIISLGGEVRFSNKLVDIKIANDAIKGAVVANKNGEYEIETENIVLAIGHSARDTFLMLQKRNINMEQKSFSVGARIEHSQEMISKSQYGDMYKNLPAADYKMAVHLENGRGVYTFCMCPGGKVVASASEKGGVVTNGMSYFARDGKNANSAILVNITPDDFDSDDALAGMYFQCEIEQRAYKLGGGGYVAPAMRVGTLIDDATDSAYSVDATYQPGVTECDLSKLFPDFIINSLRDGIRLMDKKISGFADKNAVLTAPETRSSSPVRIVRNKENFQSEILGLYPCGEGAGYAGGIMSAAVDGIKVAESIAKNNL